MNGRLTIWLGEQPVADLTASRRGELRLAYRESTVATYGLGGLCLSVALPVAPRPYVGVPAQSWCEGVLPEGETRTTLERHFQVRRGDTFALLAAIGRDCAGAVTFLDPDEGPPSAAPPRRLDDNELAASIAALPDQPLGADDDVRVSLGGLQAKLLLTRTPDGWGRPVAGTPSTHIAKPEPTDPRLQGLVAAEAMVQLAATALGIAAAEVELATWGDRQVLVVTRYDRVHNTGATTRRHQEDGAQALSIDPPSGPGKYQSLSSSSPTYARLADVLRSHAADVDEQWRRLGESMTISVAVGNTDAHVRNYSFLIGDGVVELAPLYDAAPTALFTSTRQLGLWVGGQAMLPYVTRNHLINEMSAWGLPERAATEVVEQVVSGLPTALSDAADHLELRSDLLEQTLHHVKRLAATSE